jgi:hypothetical protein
MKISAASIQFMIIVLQSVFCNRIFDQLVEALKENGSHGLENIYLYQPSHDYRGLAASKKLLKD